MISILRNEANLKMFNSTFPQNSSLKMGMSLTMELNNQFDNINDELSLEDIKYTNSKV